MAGTNCGQFFFPQTFSGVVPPILSQQLHTAMLMAFQGYHKNQYLSLSLMRFPYLTLVKSTICQSHLPKFRGQPEMILFLAKFIASLGMVGLVIWIIPTSILTGE